MSTAAQQARWRAKQKAKRDACAARLADDRQAVLARLEALPAAQRAAVFGCLGRSLVADLRGWAVEFPGKPALFTEAAVVSKLAWCLDWAEGSRPDEGLQ